MEKLLKVMFDSDGFDSDGFDRDGFDKDGFGQDGFGKDGYSRSRQNRCGVSYDLILKRELKKFDVASYGLPILRKMSRDQKDFWDSPLPSVWE